MITAETAVWRRATEPEASMLPRHSPRDALRNGRRSMTGASVHAA